MPDMKIGMGEEIKARMEGEAEGTCYACNGRWAKSMGGY